MYYIVRHGQTEQNREKALQGRSNAPLNAAGRQQAQALAAYFRARGIVFGRVYSSPLIRAVETARLIAPEHKELITDERLIEMDYGPYEGISLTNLPPEIRTFFSDFVHNPAPEGMESLASVTERMGDFLESIHGNGDRNILISVHAISMKGALEYLTPDSHGSYWSRNIPNCGLYQFRETPEGFEIPVEVLYQRD